MLDEVASVSSAQWAYLADRVRRPMRLSTLFAILTADAARRLDTFEQQLQRRRIVQEHEAAVLARRVARWEAVEARSPYRASEVH